MSKLKARKSTYFHSQQDPGRKMRCIWFKKGRSDLSMQWWFHNFYKSIALTFHIHIQNPSKADTEIHALETTRHKNFSAFKTFLYYLRSCSCKRNFYYLPPTMARKKWLMLVLQQCIWTLTTDCKQYEAIYIKHKREPWTKEFVLIKSKQTDLATELTTIPSKHSNAHVNIISLSFVMVIISTCSKLSLAWSNTLNKTKFSQKPTLFFSLQKALQNPFLLTMQEQKKKGIYAVV